MDEANSAREKRNRELAEFFQNLDAGSGEQKQPPKQPKTPEPEDRRRLEEYTLLNGMLYLLFVVPAAFSTVLGFDMSFFYLMVIVWAHEAGHGIACLLCNRVFCASAGLLGEMAVTLVPALICFRKKEIYLAGCVLMMCAGMSVEYTGVYMASAESPHGTSFAGALTGRPNDMTAENHDWSIVFTSMGVLGDSYEIGSLVEKIGDAISITFFATCLLALIPAVYGWVPSRLSTLVGAGSLLSAAYFILSASSETKVLVSLLLTAPLLWQGMKKISKLAAD